MKKRCMILWLMFLVLFVTGCGDGEESENTSTRLYYLDGEESQIVSEPYEPKATFKEALVLEYVEAMQQEPENRNNRKILPDNVTILDYSFGEADQLILNFDTNYSLLSGIREILIRAAVVKTFCQIEGVDYVEFYVNGIPHMIGEVPVGMMKADDFIDDTSEENSYNQYANLSIYFANEEGTALLESHRQVGYNGNISMEQLVVEQLIQGPIEEEMEAGMYATMPEGTSLLRVNTRDGICYVDLNEKFLEKPEGLSEEVVLYALVNSLVELSNVNRVQLRINGETRTTYQTLVLGDMMERNLDLIETEN